MHVVLLLNFQSNDKLFILLQWKLNQNFFGCFVNITEYFFSAVSLVSSSFCVGLLPRIKILFFFFSIYINELISTQNIITFLPSPLPSDNEKLPFALNSAPYLEYKYLSGSAYVVNSIAPNIECPKSKSLSALNSLKFIS